MNRFIVCLIPCFLLLFSSGFARDWPQWQGVDRLGTTTEKVGNVDWKKQPLATLWEKQIGIGFSSFAVVDGRVYAMGFASKQETVWCFAAATGEKIWTHSYPSELRDNLHEGGPGSTPTVHDGKVYTLGKIGQAFCLDATTGKVIWQQNFRKLVNAKQPEWGFTSSFLVLDELAIVDAGPLVALDRLTGELIWKTKTYRAGYGSPLPFTHGGKTLVAQLNNDYQIVVDPSDGKVLAEHKWLTSYATNGTSPVIVGNRIFVCTAYNKGCVMLEFTGDGFKEVYRNEIMRTQMANCILVDGTLYGFDRKASPRRLVKLKAMDWATGKEQWAVGDMGIGSLIQAGDHLLVLTDDGWLILVDPSPEAYRPLTRQRVLDGRCWTTPVLSGGRLFARNAKGRMVCLDLK